jgi:lipoic acid synthetase
MMTKKPPWLKVRLPGYGSFGEVKKILDECGVHTVCQSARCPNIGECWGRKTATFMILGDICSRHCRFCAVKSGTPRGILDPLEPVRISEAVKRMGLTYAVITSVDRDDLPDGGAAHFAAVVRQIRCNNPGVLIETLIPDFGGKKENLAMIAEARPDICAHNLETTERLTPLMRDRRAGYRLSLESLTILGEISPHMRIKSGIMVGLGETDDEVYRTIKDIRGAGADTLTIGQYLQPTKKQAGVDRYVTPGVFARYKKRAVELGFRSVSSGPLVRSSYHADGLFMG